MEEDIKILEEFLKNMKKDKTYSSKGFYKHLENLIKGYRKLEEKNKELKASHIITHNKVSDEEKAKLFDVIDNSIDTFLDKIETKKEQGCKLLECKLVDKNIKLNKEIIDLKHNSIPKSKIKEILEELKEIKNIFAIDKPQYKAELSYAIRVLKELMEDK